VVDAGGYGVTLLIAGVIAGLRGAHDEIPEVAHHAVELRPHGPDHESSAYRYCTNFVVSGGGLAPGRTWLSLLEDIGDSVLVVGDARTMRVHVHTDDPEQAVAVFARAGTVERLDVADMHEQEEQRVARLAGRASRPATVAVVRCGVVAVAAGAGMRRLYEQLGAHVIEGGSTLNPSTFELLAGIHEVAADEVVVLPNSANVILAAERAAELSEKDVAVVESRCPQAGLVCLVEHDPDRGVEANVQRLRAALDGIRTGAVAPAARDDKQGRFSEGDAVGFVDEAIVAWGTPEATLRSVLEALAEDRELLTCVSGDGAPLGDSEVEGLAPASIEIEYLVGGQPHYWWLLAAE
jgi:dihydroxyacetone kinase-like predicted kinase